MNPTLSAVPIDLPGHKRCLRTFVTLRANDLDAGTNSGWAHVAMLGGWEGHSQGPFAFTTDAFKQILQNFSQQANPIPLDYEHDTFNPGSTGPKPASGWIRRLELRNNDTELWAYVDWTPRAAQMIRDGEYRFTSPVVDFESIDRRTNKDIGAELLSVALTNNPFLDGQHPLQLTWVAQSSPPPDDKRPPSSAEPKGPPPFPLPNPPPPHAPGHSPPPKDDPPPMAAAQQQPPSSPAPAAPPPPIEQPSSTAADAALGSGSEADANAWLSAVADMVGLDKTQTLAALMDMKDKLVNDIQKTISRDGTPAEARRSMTVTADNTTQTAQPAAAPAAATPPTNTAPAAAADGAAPITMDELERKRDKETIAAMAARLEVIERERAAEKEAAIVALVDQKIRDGYVAADGRDNAIWAFKTDRARAEQIYGQKLIPIGARQSTTAPAVAGAGSNVVQATVIDMTQFSRAELMTIDCLVGAHKTREQAVQIVLAKRRN